MSDKLANLGTTPSSFRIYPNEDLQCGEKLYLDATTADVYFSFDNTPAQVAAHKNILAVTSDVFKPTFYGPMKKNGNTVHEPFVSDAEFMEFLQYFYLNEVKLCVEHVEAVLLLGDKYNVEKCVNDCVQFLIDTLDDENVCSRLRLAILCELPEFKKVCEKRIMVNTAAILASKGFLTCDKQVLEHILKMNQFSCSEVKVFEAIMSWVKVKSKQPTLSNELVQAQLGDLIYHIRFASMKIQEFCVLAKKYDSILSSYHRIITDMIVLADARNEGTGNFNAWPRHAKWNKNAIIKCDREPKRRLGCEVFMVEKIKFSTNESLLLGSFTCASICDALDNLQSNLIFDVKIYELHDVRCENESGNLLLKMKTKLNLNKQQTKISLPKPILVRPGFFYAIEVKPFPQTYRLYSDVLKKQVELDSNIIIKFHGPYSDYDADAECAYGELIVGLDFNQI